MIKVIHGECREVMAGMEPESFSACCTDPPYELNFMSRHWDRTGVAFRVETWAAVLRVLKPGGFLVAFGGARTYHRMACAIEDAGFEIRDSIGDIIASDTYVRQFMASLSEEQQRAFMRCIDESQFGGLLSWCFAAGFPKSHDVSKAIDRRGGADISWFGPWLRRERERRGITQKTLAKHFPSKTGGMTGCVANWELNLNLPTVEQFNSLCEILELPFSRIQEAERKVTGRSENGIAGGSGRHSGIEAAYGFRREFDLTAPATDAAKQWQGWGTALKPAWEPIVLARKPLSEGTVAENCLKHGCGALNIDASRVACAAGDKGDWPITDRAKKTAVLDDGLAEHVETAHSTGRWPSNVCHDGSEEVLAAFARFKAPGQQGDISTAAPSEKTSTVYGRMRREGEASADRRYTANGSTNFAALPGQRREDGGGSPARFFFCGKAQSWEREGGHPTVKPLELLKWLVTLVTPPGGTVLDPFCGSGTTLAACEYLGIDAIGIDISEEYIKAAEQKISRLRARRLLGKDARPAVNDPAQMALDI